MLAETTDEQVTFEFEIDGMSCQIVSERDGQGIREAHGKFVSHTGYRSLYSMDRHEPGTDLYPLALAEAKKLYEENRDAPFLVGRFDAPDVGWKDLAVWQRHVRIRLCSWHEGKVAAALEELGFQLTCALNLYYEIPEDTLSLSRCAEALAPLREPGSRYVDEDELVKRLKKQLDATGIALEQAQIGLF